MNLWTFYKVAIERILREKSFNLMQQQTTSSVSLLSDKYVNEKEQRTQALRIRWREKNKEWEKSWKVDRAREKGIEDCATVRRGRRIASPCLPHFAQLLMTCDCRVGASSGHTSLHCTEIICIPLPYSSLSTSWQDPYFTINWAFQIHHRPYVATTKSLDRMLDGNQNNKWRTMWQSVFFNIQYGF